MTLTDSRGQHWLPVGAAAGTAFVALLVRRRLPLPAVVACALIELSGNIGTVPMMVALYTVAARRGPNIRTWAAVLVAAGASRAFGWPGALVEWKYVALAVGLLIVLPVVSGLWMFSRKSLLEALRERADHAERERDLLAERAVTAERRRIAREMHDVVAHRVTVIALQAGALSVTSDNAHTEEVAEVIRKTGTTALTELREILRVLRDDEPGDADPPVPAPAPGLAAIGRLIDDAASAGTAAVVSLPDPLPEIGGVVGRAAYRVAQEALTNAVKHAPGAAIRVSVDVLGTELVVEVSNKDRIGALPAPVPGSGYGLIGMRERVSLAGGTVHSGHTGEGEYVVRARFPLGTEEENP